MPNSQLLTAVAKGKTLWLRTLLSERLPELDSPSVDYDAWFDSIIFVMESRGLVEPKQQKNFLTDIRNAIKVLNPQHPALDVVKFDKATWTEINNTDSDAVATRTTKLLSDPDAIVTRATSLLSSFHWSEIAAGLAVVTGRRCTEIIKTANFELKTKYSVTFSGSLKRRSEPVECVFEIPTLCPAQSVIQAISNLRHQLGDEIQSLTPRQVSGRYSRAVARECDRQFNQLVPPRDDGDNLYTHLFRAIYATIAAFWYCPPSVPEMEFRAAIQGHYQIRDETNPKLRRSLAAGRHYFDYKIGDGRGNLDGRLGIKLSDSNVTVIEEFAAFYPTTTSDTPMSNPSSANDTSSQNNHFVSPSIEVVIPSFLLSRLKVIGERLGLSTADTIQALFTWTEVSLSLADELGLNELNPHTLFESVTQLQQTSNSSTPEASSYPPAERTSHAPGFDPGGVSSSLPQSFNDLCASVKLLAETVHQQSSLNKRTSSTPQNSVQDNPTTDTDDDDDDDNSKNQKPQNDYHHNRSEEAEVDVKDAIDAIINFNNSEGLAPKAKWYIGIGSLRKLTSRGDSVIKRVLEQNSALVEQHNAQHQLGKWHNAKGKDAQSIDEVISY